MEANAGPEGEARPGQDEERIKDVLEQLQTIRSQVMLHGAIARLALSAGEWKCLARALTGYSVTSVQDARETIETFLSDRLLLEERLEGVKRQFSPRDL